MGQRFGSSFPSRWRSAWKWRSDISAAGGPAQIGGHYSQIAHMTLLFAPVIIARSYLANSKSIFHHPWM